MIRSGARWAALFFLSLVPVLRGGASIRVAGAEYVSLSEEAHRIGMAVSWMTPSRRMVLSGEGHHAEFEGDSREASIDGVRVFLGDPAVARTGDIFVSRVDFYRRLLGILRPSLWGPAPPHPRVIALDPGHGGRDHGTENKRLGILEKTCTLDVALKLKPMLEAQGFQVILTRGKMAESEGKIDLGQLAATAIAEHADLFVSIHFNALPENPKTQGTEVYMFPPQYQYSTVYWTNGHKAEDIREAAPANQRDPWNAAFAHIMHKDVLDELHNPDRGEKLEHLGVLRPLPMPGILVESGFLSNDEEARRCASPQYQERIARALDQGIVDFVALLDSVHGVAAPRKAPGSAPAGASRAPAATLPPPPAAASLHSQPTRPS